MCAILRENTLEFQQAVNKLLDDNSNSYESLETLKNRIEHNFQIKDTYKEPKWSRTLHHPGIDVNEWIVTRNEDSPGKLVGAYLN